MQPAKLSPKRKIPNDFFSTGYRQRPFAGVVSNGYLKSDKHDITDTEDTENSDAETVTFEPAITRRPSPEGMKTGSSVSFRPHSSSTTAIAEGYENIYLNQTPAISAEVLASLETPIRPTIQNVIERDGELLFLVGLESPIWVHYSQVEQSSEVRCFLQMLSRREWSAFLRERENEAIEGGDLAIGNIGDELPVEKVLEMKMWGGQWMVRIDVGTVELDINDVEGLGLVDDAVEFCVQNDWSN